VSEEELGTGAGGEVEGGKCDSECAAITFFPRQILTDRGRAQPGKEDLN